MGTGAPIMNIAILDDMWITFNVREDLLQGLGMNTEFEAFIPALDKNIRLKVYYMKTSAHMPPGKRPRLPASST